MDISFTKYFPDEQNEDRNSSFEKAETFFKAKKLDAALKYYLKCIKGIEQGGCFDISTSG